MKSQFKVLIVDDEVEICYLLSRILRKHGIEVNYVNNISDAKSIFDSFSPSIVFLDNHLPDGLGVEFANYLKTHYPETLIIIITGKETNLEQAKINGATEIIFKPFTSDRILSVIEKHA